MDSNELLVSILRSFRCYNQVEALGNLIITPPMRSFFR